MDNRMNDKLLESDNEDNKDLKGRVWRESKMLWRIAFPAIITRVSSFGILVVTQAFIGHIGESELASYALVQSLIVRFLNGILLGMASALDTLCGQAFGARQYHMMGIYLQRSWIVLLTTGIIFLPLLIFTTPIFRLLGEEEELSTVAGTISIWFLPIVPYFIFSMTMQMYLQAQLKNMIIGWLSTASIIIHVILSWLFVDKLNLGIPGAMGALIISTWSMLIGEFVYVFGGWCPDTWTGFSKAAFSELWPVVKLSLSSGVMLCLELWYNSILVLLAGYMKNAEIAISAFSICVRVANELGRGDTKAAKFSIKVISCTSLGIGVLFWIFFLFFGNSISYVFTSNAEIAKAVSSLSVLLAFSVLLNSVQPVLTGKCLFYFLRVAIGAGWQSVVAYVNIACYYLIGIPLGILLGYVADLEIRGIWIGMICGVALQTLVLIYITWRTNWDEQVNKASERLNRWFLPPSEESNENSNHA
ncbi:hypothetical protein HHK36_017011 [Tetracentron sinense]|uniref:Protein DETOXIFICATION n=1 Tax=Tetracentron sinense TaxID=13715 RepID=A0A834Z2C4_TETSI|nr:hypothetical protein HHK36_017011 [Tetracentron sinense]